jgi:hypothetical protein
MSDKDSKRLVTIVIFIVIVLIAVFFGGDVFKGFMDAK